MYIVHWYFSQKNWKEQHLKKLSYLVDDTASMQFITATAKFLAKLRTAAIKTIKEKRFCVPFTITALGKLKNIFI